MPGTYVKDNIEPVLLNATVTASGNDTAVEVDYPHDVRVVCAVTGAVSGTSPTLDIEVQGADDSAFTTNKVSYGRFAQLTASDASSATVHYLQARVYKKYMRTVRTIGGSASPTFTTVQVQVRSREWERVAKTDTA
jgi:hypothetical protein